MKAIIEMNGKNIEVLGKDLTIDSNMLTSEIYVVDRADDRRVFSGHKSVVDCVRIIDNMDNTVVGYLSAIRADAQEVKDEN